MSRLAVALSCAAWLVPCACAQQLAPNHCMRLTPLHPPPPFVSPATLPRPSRRCRWRKCRCVLLCCPALCLSCHSVLPLTPHPTITQDVELQSNCLLTCFGLKAVNVQTAGQGGSPMPEVSASFLAAPEKVREAIQLAVKLYRQRTLPAAGGSAYRCARLCVTESWALWPLFTMATSHTRPPAHPLTSRVPIAAWSEGQAGGGRPMAQQAGGGGGSLCDRLHRLEALVTRGVLSRQEADELKVRVCGSQATVPALWPG